MRKRERIDRMGRERTNFVERWSETESEGERAIVGGGRWGWKRGTTTTVDRARELGYRTRRGMVYEEQGGIRHCDLSVRT